MVPQANDDVNLKARRRLFEPLHDELDALLGKKQSRVLRDRTAQSEFGAAAGPMITRWVTESARAIHDAVGGFIELPSADEQYKRNSVFRSWESHIGLFAHVWKPNGATPIHHHEGLLALACPVGNAIEEIRFSLVQPHTERHAEDKVVELTTDSRETLSFAAVTSIPRGRGSIHVISNRGDSYCAIIEAYVHPEPPDRYDEKRPNDTPLYWLNTYIPIHGMPGQYWVLRRSTVDLPVSLETLAARSDETFDCEALLAELRDSQVGGRVVTRDGKTFATMTELRRYCEANPGPFARVSVLKPGENRSNQQVTLYVERS